jgi:hypothetical protein
VARASSRSRAADPRVYCAAAAVRVSRKAGITSFAKRSRFCELEVEQGAERGCANDAVEAGIAFLDRLQVLDDVLRPAGQEATGPHSILDRRRFEGPPARRSRADLFSLFYPVEIRHRQLP